MNIRHFIALLTFFLIFNQVNAQNFSVSGYVTDAETGETLIGATIQVKNELKAVITNNLGYYSLTGLKAGEYSFIISYLGYQTKEIKINMVDRGLILDEIKLVPVVVALDEVSITATKPDEIADKQIETSHIELTPKMISSIPTAGNDVFAAIKYMPGINRTEPYSPLYTVRGGDPGENAVMLDGVMIYNPYHSSVTSGIFNTQTIKNVDLLVGGFGASFGGRNSSVMYITTKDGNYSELHGEIEPSTFHSKMFFEFPVGEKASMMVAGRYMYDLPFNFIFHSTNYFYDLNISYTNRINDRNRLSLKFFESKDYTGFDFNTYFKYLENTFQLGLYDNMVMEQRNDWKNRAATIIHKYIVSPRIFIRNQFYYSSHKSKNYTNLDFVLSFEEDSVETDYQWVSKNQLSSLIADYGGKTSVTFNLSNFDEIVAGLEYNIYEFNNNIKINGVDNGSFDKRPSLIAGFIENKLELKHFIIRPGVRFTSYENQGWNYEPRLNITIRIPRVFNIKAAYGEYLQYIISMNTNELEMSQIVDYYYPLNELSPSKSIHFILGVEKQITSELSISVDAYYKEMPKVYAFDMNNVFGFTNKIQEGTGDAYGIEVLLEGKHKKVSGWASYSYSMANRHFPNSEINNGEPYAFEYNRPHTFKSVVNYQLTNRFSINTSLVFLAGAKRSVETTMQSYYYYDPATNTTTTFPLWTTSGKNSAKMPPVINFDIGFKKRLLSGMGKQLSDLLNADDSFVTVTIRNILFMYRNVEYYIPGTGIPGYEDKYLPVGSNYTPSIGISYTLKF